MSMKASQKHIDMAMKVMKCDGPYYVPYTRRDSRWCITHGRKWGKHGCKFASRVANAIVSVDTAPVI